MLDFDFVYFANDLHVTIVARIVEGIIISLTYHCLCIGRFNDEWNIMFTVIIEIWVV